MSTLTLEQLLGTRTLQQVRDDISTAIYNRATADPTVAEITEWVSGGVLKTLFEIDAEAVYQLEQLIPALAESGFVDLASGDWLTYLAKSQYDLDRAVSVFTLDTVRLTNSSASPYTITVNQLWFTTATGVRFNNTQGGTLAANGGTLDVQVIGENPGASFNVPRGTITSMVTPLSGVTCTNITGGLIRAGVDTESDERLRVRCKTRWPSLGAEPTKDAMVARALAASPSITRVKVADNAPRGPGTVDVCVYGEGGIGSSVVTDDRLNPPTSSNSPYYPGTFTPGSANLYLQDRRGLATNLYVFPATPIAVNVQAVMKVRTGYRSQAEPKVLANLAALALAVDIGGTLYKNAVIDALLERAAGMIDVTLTNPVTDTVLATDQVLEITSTLTWQEVNA